MQVKCITIELFIKYGNLCRYSMAFILFIIGLIVLVKGADYLVDGASSLAGKFRIRPIVIGLTVVAFGTSAPELVVSLMSAYRGSTDIALGNVLGSNIFNILLIVGLSASIYPLVVNKNTTWKEIPLSLLAILIAAMLGLSSFINNWTFDFSVLSSQSIVGEINRSGGLILLSFFIIFLYYTFGISKATGDADIIINKRSMLSICLYIGAGLLGLTLGSQLAVDNAVSIARLLGLSDTLIGLTLISAGTSFPELFTNIAAARKKDPDIAVGNIVGSNIFNVLLILGTTALFKSVPIKGFQIVDIAIVILSTSILFFSIFVWKKHSIGRKEGIIMLLGYIAYTVFLVMRG